MSAASVGQPHAERPMIAAANRIMEQNPGYRVEIAGGQILVSPAPDGPHSQALMRFARPFMDEEEILALPGIGLWLPTGPEDYVIPDLSVVDDDYRSRLVENGCYDPMCFRLVMEVTSSNWRTDLRTKVGLYAKAKIPVYVIVDRQHERFHVLTNPARDSYATHHIHHPGEKVTLPESIGAEVTLDVAEILKAGEPRRP
ncbi:Uma2 family endonuclease [Streptomyces sp. Da 82-17]|uniref:Uma2 family endonuclease n=1 Tax=Streptomyces sp. Da 82-17 TaxID=3377116 RepID=UPI0038D3C5FF